MNTTTSSTFSLTFYVSCRRSSRSARSKDRRSGSSGTRPPRAKTSPRSGTQIPAALKLAPERSSIGTGSVIGRGSVVDNDVDVGARVRVQTGVYLTAFTLVEDDVFIGPGVTTTNDNTMARHERDERLRGPTLRRACRVGGGVVLAPGVEVGEEAFVAAGAVVTEDVPARAVVMGVPARRVRDVGEEDLLERWR